MNYFTRFQQLLQLEKEEDRWSFEELIARLSVNERRENGMCWYPIAIRDTETGRGDYLNVEVEPTTHPKLLQGGQYRRNVIDQPITRWSIPPKAGPDRQPMFQPPGEANIVGMILNPKHNRWWSTSSK